MIECDLVVRCIQGLIVPVASAVFVFFVSLILESFIPGIFFMSDIWACALLTGTVKVCADQCRSKHGRRVR